MSLVAGALRAPVAELGSRPDVGWTGATVGTFVLAAVVGAALLLAIDRYALEVGVGTGTGADA